jgi:UDP-glucose 4-epimerase
MKNKSVLVTGGAGFIGSNLVKRLVRAGANVSVVVKYHSIIDCPRLCSVWNKIEVVEADLRNTDSVFSLQDREFDTVFHLAAYNHVGDSFNHASEAIQSNLLATVNLLESGPKWKRFIYTSTSEVYGYQTEVPFREMESIPFPISPYSIGKYSGELYARMKRHQTEKEIITLRPFNTFGPYQSERAVIPELIIRCLRGLAIRTTEGKQTREFNYVDNIVDGFIAAATVENVPESVVNLGSGEEIAIRDLVQMIHQKTESKSSLEIGALPNRPTEIWRMSSEAEIAKENFGWSPNIKFEEGLEHTIAWYRNYLKAFYEKDSILHKL